MSLNVPLTLPSMSWRRFFTPSKFTMPSYQPADEASNCAGLFSY